MASRFISRCILTLLALNVLLHNVASEDYQTIEKYHSKVDIDSVDSLDVLNSSNETGKFTFGRCRPGKESCRDCYLTLVKELLGNDENVLNLSLAFTAPVQDEPNSVIVTYNFINDTMHSKATWFWAQSGAYFLHPLFVFQFISLLFGNPRPLYEREVDVTLNATECYGVQNNLDVMILLTQRLKLHIQQQTINPKIPDTYMPTAVNNETFESMINNVTNRPISNLQLSARKLLHDCPIVITIFTILLVIIVLIMYICSGSLKKRGELPLNNQTKATIVSIAFVSFVRIVIFLGLDTEAIKYRHDHQGSKVIAIYNNVTMKDIYSTPWILLAFDTIALGFHIVITFIAFLHIYLFSTDKTTRCYTTMRKMFWYLQNTCHIWNDFNYYCLSLTVVPMIISGLNHAPYIIMAYVSDGAFASSIFLYYMIALFVEFGLIQFTLKTYFDSPASNRNYRRYVSSCLMIVQAPVISLLINGLMATTFLYLFFMPIKYVLRNAPSQVVVVYQSAALFVGAYITYKAVFKAEKNETKITKESKEMEISRLILERAHTDVNDEARRSFLKLKVTHRRQEVMLTDINGKVNNILDGHIDQIEADNIVALHDEHSRILKRLGEYIAANRDAADEDRELQHEKKEEVHHLEKVTATQLHHKIIQLWRESAQRNDKRIKSLTEEFKGLPEGLVRTDLSHAKTIYFPDENVHFCNPWLCSTCCNPQNLSEGPSERHPSVQ